MYFFAMILAVAVALGSGGGGGTERQPSFIGARGDLCDPTTGCPSELYVNTARQLYRIDLANGQPVASLVGNLGAEITDIARMNDGRIFGVSFTALYEIEPAGGQAHLVGPLRVNNVNGLTSAGGRLLASSTDGFLHEINAATGQATRVGTFGPGIGSSGDLCFGPGGQLYLTSPAGRGPQAIDRLMRVDPVSGSATFIGSTGQNRIYGLTYTGQFLLGFTETGTAVQIDPLTGAARPLAALALPFWGAS